MERKVRPVYVRSATRKMPRTTPRILLGVTFDFRGFRKEQLSWRKERESVTEERTEYVYWVCFLVRRVTGVT